MANKVRAGVLVAPGVTEIREFDMPKLGKGAAICKVLKAGICGTNKHSFRGESVQYKGTANEIDLPFPITTTKLRMYDMLPKNGVDHFRKIAAGKQLWNYDNLEPNEKKLVL